MSFNSCKEIVEEGDTVILYLAINKIYSINAVPHTTNKKGFVVDKVFQTSYGALRANDLIGKRYGSKVNLSAGWGYIFQPTPELWTLTLPHRTQIIYTPDIGMIIMQLDIHPGSVVVESGTGSGSLSHAIIRSVKPNGHLHTFDFHKQRVEIARDEFRSHGLDNYTTVCHRDVCAEGFGDELNEKVDAVFLDLPAPDLAIPHAVKALKKSGGRICTFSPCIEQVQKSCEIMKSFGFEDIVTIEVLQTQYSVQTRPMPVLNLDFVRTTKSENDTKKEKEFVKVLTSVPPQTMCGHTGYLTAATLPPFWARRVKGEGADELSGEEDMDKQQENS